MGVAFDIKEYIENNIENLRYEISGFKRKPCLAIISADGFDEASNVYIKNKINTAVKIGIDVRIFGLEWQDVSPHEFRNHIFKLIN